MSGQRLPFAGFEMMIAPLALICGRAAASRAALSVMTWIQPDRILRLRLA